MGRKTLRGKKKCRSFNTLGGKDTWTEETTWNFSMKGKNQLDVGNQLEGRNHLEGGNYPKVRNCLEGRNYLRGQKLCKSRNYLEGGNWGKLNLKVSTGKSRFPGVTLEKTDFSVCLTGIS